MGLFSDVVSAIEKLGTTEMFGIACIVVAIFSPGIAVLYWWNTDQFASLSSVKILLLSGSLGSLTALIVSPSVAAAVKNDDFDDKQAIVLIAVMSLVIQLFAILLCYIGGRVSQLASMNCHSLASVIALSLVLAVSQTRSAPSWTGAAMGSPSS